MSVVEQIHSGRHVSLTTFRSDGRGVATALWFVVDTGELSVLTAPDSGKVKRIRNNDRVIVALCDDRGGIAADAPKAEGTARLLDEADTARVHNLMARKYVAVRLADWWDTLRGRPRPWMGIAITVAAAVQLFDSSPEEVVDGYSSEAETRRGGEGQPYRRGLDGDGIRPA